MALDRSALKLLACLGCLVVCASGLSAQGNVSVPEQRREVIDGIYRALQTEDRDAFLAQLEETYNPLTVWREEEPEPERVPDQPVREPVQVRKLTDREAVAYIARRLRPTGQLISSTSAILNLEGGRSLRLNQRFRVSIGGVPYIAELVRVTDKDFTLRVGRETFTRSLLDDQLRSGAIRRTNPSPSN